jgi:hypothetical protein
VQSRPERSRQKLAQKKREREKKKKMFEKTGWVFGLLLSPTLAGAVALPATLAGTWAGTLRTAVAAHAAGAACVAGGSVCLYLNF